MSELQEIDVIIAADGTVKLEIRGVKGGKCVDYTKDMEALLGGEIIDREFTDEYYQQTQQQDDWNPLRN